MPAARPLLGRGGDEHLEGRVGKDHGAHVAAVGDEPRTPAERPLAGKQRGAHGGVNRDPRRRGTDRFAANRLRDIAALLQDAAVLEVDVERLCDRRERRPVVRIDLLRERLVGDEPVKRAAVEQVEPERLRNTGRHRPLARRRRAVDRDHRHRRGAHSASTRVIARKASQ
jgi:hypothetical protein